MVDLNTAIALSKPHQQETNLDKSKITSPLFAKLLLRTGHCTQESHWTWHGRTEMSDNQNPNRIMCVPDFSYGIIFGFMFVAFRGVSGPKLSLRTNRVSRGGCL